MANIIYNDNGALISKENCTRFNSLMSVLVPKDVCAVFYLGDKVYDVLYEGEYSLETKNIPLISSALSRPDGDMTDFECSLCFVNLNATLGILWETSNGKKGIADIKVSDAKALVETLLQNTDLDVLSVSDYFKNTIEQNADESLPDFSGVNINYNITFDPQGETEIQKPEITTEEAEKPEKNKKKSPVLKIAIALIIIGVLICLAVAVFFKPDSNSGKVNTPGTVVSDGSPELLDIDRDVTLVELGSAKIGDFVSFGSFEQDAETSNGAEALVWQVIDVKDGVLTLMTRYGIEAIEYNSTFVEVDWRNCSLRKWLQGDFYNGAFTPAEKAKIVAKTNKNALKTNYNLEDGNNTDDTVFVLSIDEMFEFFPGGENHRQAKATASAVANGAYVDDATSNCCRYWLRSPGDTPDTAAFVENDGYIARYGDGVSNKILCVRPVICVSVN